MSNVHTTISKYQFWHSSLKKIEGKHGTAIVAYFLLLKWMFFLNLITFVTIFFMITVPTVVLKDTGDCGENETIVENESVTNNFHFADLFQGTGIMEDTALFYGFYPNRIFCFWSGSNKMYYNLPMVYLSIMILYFLLSWVSIVRSAVKGYQEGLAYKEDLFYQLGSLIFAGWEFSIQKENSAKIKHRTLLNEIKATLKSADEVHEDKKMSRIYFIRTCSTIITIIILGLSGAAIYYTFDYSTRELKSNSEGSLSFIFQFLPSLCIVCLNMIVPLIFKKIVQFEGYKSQNELNITLYRTIGLRLASLLVLYYSMYDQIQNNQNIDCWETFVGQQIYKLLLTDFLTHLFLTFFVNFPRSLLGQHCNSNNKIVTILTQQNFELNKHVLDVVYSQTLCWFGFFYAPLLSAMASIVFFLLFYIKKFNCLVNTIPNAVLYRASRSNSIFMFVLLISFLFAFLPFTLSIAEITPSTTCGPFQGQNKIWDLVTDLISTSPNWFQDISYFVTTAAFAIPVFLILCLALYYYTAVNAANKHMVSYLKHQLLRESRLRQRKVKRNH